MYNVGIFLFNDVELLDFAGPYEVFSVTAELSDFKLFKVFTITDDGGEIKSIHGLRVTPDYSFNNHPPVDILIIPGGQGSRKEITKDWVLGWIAGIHNQNKITMSVCSGARILAKLGFLDNIEATTHHLVTDNLKEVAPKVILREDLRFVDNGKIMTSGGVAAGIDLSLYIVEKLYGKEIADKTKVYIEYDNWREVR